MTRRLALLFICFAALTAPARAEISGATLIDGPSSSIRELGNVAMAPDGTGGMAYLKSTADGRDHVFAAQFTGGRWLPPQRIDVGQDFNSSWPRIGAGNGGRLSVIWVQQFSGANRMYSAALDPGANRFQAPVTLELNVGSDAFTQPSIAMNAVGQALLVYRVDGVNDTGQAPPPGTQYLDTKIARYSGTIWNTVDSPVTRNSAIPVNNPTPLVAPQVGIDVNGNGVVAFLEPDDTFVDRVYARRTFSNSVGFVQQASPEAIKGAPVDGPVDAFSLDVTGFGLTAVAYRQQTGPRAGLRGARTVLATLPEAFDPNARSFTAPRLVDGGAADGPAEVGPPSAGIAPKSGFLVGFGSGAASVGTTGDDQTVAKPDRLDDGSSSVPGDPVVDAADGGAGVAAMKLRVGNRGGVSVLERGRDGVPERKLVAAPGGGGVRELDLSGSGLGDALIGFVQGTGGGTQIAAAAVDSPPSEFIVQTPTGFTRKSSVKLTWDPSLNAGSPVTYDVRLDDEVVANNLKRVSTVLGRKQLEDGKLEVKVVATDALGQETTSLPAELKVDRLKPRARVRRKGRVVRLTVSDRPRDGSGVGATRIKWGDGSKGKRAKAKHRYKRGGRFTIRITTRDKAGNRAKIRLKVRL